MATQIKVNRKDLIVKLSSIKEDNISIADIAISRKRLLEALKLQTQADADILTINYGKVSWRELYDTSNTIDNETSIQISCNHTVMRFLNRPYAKYGRETKVIPLNFIDYRAEQVKQELTGIPIDTQELIEALTFVIHGVETDGTRPALECVLFDCDKNKLTLVTADGFRLPVATMTVKGMTKKQVLIHRLDIPKLLTFLKSGTEGKGRHKTWLDTYIDIRESKTQFMSDKGKIEFDNQTGTYPNYALLIPDIGTHIQVIAFEMLEAVKLAGISAKDGSGIVRLKFNKYPDRLTVIARSEEVSDTIIECQALVDRECYIAVNGKYLIDFLSTCKDNVIDLFVDKPSSPMVVYKNQEQLETIMPMFVQW